MNTEEYYKTEYSRKQIEADLSRKNRLKFCISDKLVGKRILSVGCGPAVDIDLLIKDNEVHGIDISDSAIEIARTQGVITHKIDLNISQELNFPSSNFDIIVATDILEHLLFPLSLLNELRRILKDEGFAIISVPNHFYLNMRLRIMQGKGIILPFHNSIEWEYFHIRFFNSASFEKLIRLSGFKIINRYYDEFMCVPKLLKLFLPRRVILKFPDLFSLHFIVKIKKTL